MEIYFSPAHHACAENAASRLSSAVSVMGQAATMAMATSSQGAMALDPAQLAMELSR